MYNTKFKAKVAIMWLCTNLQKLCYTTVTVTEIPFRLPSRLFLNAFEPLVSLLIMAAVVLPRTRPHASNVAHVREGMAMVRKLFGVGPGNAPRTFQFIHSLKFLL